MSASDDARVLVRLLWRHRVGDPRTPRRGPRQRVTVDGVIRAAIDLADARDLAAVSMRALADRMGVGPMSLYTYVPNRDALVALMIDEVAAEDRPFDLGQAPDLDEAVAAIGRALRDEHARHPWLLDASRWRSVLGPHRLARFDRQLALLEAHPLTDVERDRVISLVTDLAAGSAREARDAGWEVARSGMSDSEWWDVVGPELDAVIGDGEFPLAGRVGSVVGQLYEGPGDTAGAFEFGLACIVDGVRALLAGRVRGVGTSDVTH
ncbi:TetR/AcrR family transcriptional regulator [Gordonia sp. SL306]|uniref:TetR/AcrR family transcriptional regulator n=1 Tax=Gordonia sp. SL306 TaxID=2995145 RepID=UPI0022703FC1|nr:TetR/AcrR family transcriptional regulator [Gordonia sp. SL306]WAC55740.1 TetR/AcrR family transcriptional regulator [Gordonia sp. SL306]